MLNQTRQQRGEPSLGFGLALHVGDVIYGNIGVPERLQFTVIAAAANEAARLAGLEKLDALRLEAATKEIGIREKIQIGDQTRA